MPGMKERHSDGKRQLVTIQIELIPPKAAPRLPYPYEIFCKGTRLRNCRVFFDRLWQLLAADSGILERQCESVAGACEARV